MPPGLLCTLLTLSCDLQLVRLGPSWTEECAGRLGVALGPVTAKWVAPCCQEPCREPEDCEVLTDRVLDAVEADSERGILAPTTCADGEVECTASKCCSGAR